MSSQLIERARATARCCVVLVVVTHPVIAANAQSGQISPVDAAAGDLFGYSMAVDGDLAVIGAPFGDDLGTDTGKVYVFRRDANSGQWVEQHVLMPSGPLSEIDRGHFGESVDILGDIIVVGAPGDHIAALWGGATYVFRWNPVTVQWDQEAKLTASDVASDDKFGEAVAVRGGVLAVGVRLHDQGGISNSGAAYVFRHDPNSGVWNEEQKLAAPVQASGNYFGHCVALNHQFLVIGEPAADGANSAIGRVHLYTYDGASWITHSLLDVPDADAAFQFGSNLAVDGDRLAVVTGSKGDDPLHAPVMIFEFDGTTWNQSAALTPCQGVSTSLPRTVDLAGDWMLLGAQGDTRLQGDYAAGGWIWYAGAAFAFHFDGVSWFQDEMFFLSDGQMRDRLGSSVALWSDEALVGAVGDDDNADGAGLVHVFTDLVGTDYVGNDCNGNGLTDRCEIAEGSEPDCNDNDIPDSCDVALGYFDDCDANNVPDDCDVSGDGDCNGNNVPDVCDVALANSLDCNADGLPDECEITDYRLDDGHPEVVWQQGGGAEWINHFTVSAGEEVITSMTVVWPAFTVDGASASLNLYDDPNNDGDPSDRVIVYNAPVTAVRTETVGFVDRVDILPTDIGSAGDGFFVGLQVSGAGQFALSDETSPLGRSWLDSGGTLSQLDDHNLLIRADATHSAGLPLDCQARGDSNGDGLVNVTDLLALLAAWDDCPAWPETCPADTNGDGAVNVADLLVLLSGWGSF